MTYDKRSENERLVHRSLSEGKYRKAIYHMLKVSQISFDIAEKSEGYVKNITLKDAFSYLEMAERLKLKLDAREIDSKEKKEEILVNRGTEEKDKTSNKEEEFKLKSKITLNDVAGMDEVKNHIKDTVINPMNYPEIYKEFKEPGGSGVMLYGPPGNGKTLFGKAIANEINAPFYIIDETIKSKYVGEAPKALTRVFEEATEHERAVIFIDEADSILPHRTSQRYTLVNTFLQLTDGIKDLSNNCVLLVILATNNPHSIDEAVTRPKRISEIIYVGLPDEEARLGILTNEYNGVPVEPEFPYREFAKKMKGFSGADVYQVARKAKFKAMGRKVRAPETQQFVTIKDFEEEIDIYSPSVTKDQIKKLKAWANRRKKIKK